MIKMGNCYKAHYFNSLILLTENSDIYQYYSIIFFVLLVGLTPSLTFPCVEYHVLCASREESVYCDLSASNSTKNNKSICIIHQYLCVQKQPEGGELHKSCRPPQSARVQVRKLHTDKSSIHLCDEHAQVQKRKDNSDDTNVILCLSYTAGVDLTD